MFASVEKLQLKVPAHIDYLGDLRDFVTQLGRRHHFSEKIVNAFKLAVDEAATNIIRHAYRDSEGLITIRAVVKKNSLTLSIIDQGKYFDPNRVENPDLNRYIDIGKKGGLGIFIMRKLMDEIDYRKTEEGNELRITKYRDQAEKKGIIKSAVSSIPFSIKVKYFFRALAIIAAIITLGYLYFFFRVEDEIKSRFLDEAQKANRTIVNRIVARIEESPDEFIGDDEFFAAFEEQFTDVIKISVEDSTDFIIYSSDTTEYIKGLIRPDDVEQAEAPLKDLPTRLYKYNLDDQPVYEFESQLFVNVTPEETGLPERAHYGTSHIIFSEETAQQQISVRQLANLQLALIILGMSCVGVALLIYLLMNPFRKLSEWVKNLGHGEIEDEMDIDASTEIGEIAKAFSDITHKFRDSQKNLAQQERLQREMRVAKDIQQTLLPLEFPELEGYQISAYYEAATEVGGDYYDFVEVDKDTLGIAVADVSGKGVPGSLVMTMIRTALRTEARGLKDAAEVLARVNDFVNNDIKKGMFVTVFYLIIDSKKRSLNFASAGHNPMILRRSSTKLTYYLNPKGYPIGVKLPDKDYFRKYIESETIKLTKDDILLLYTDGITEAMNAKRELFGEERLQKVVSDFDHLSAQEFVESLKGSIHSFTEGQPQNDDITLVALKEESTKEEDELRRARELHKLVSHGTSVRDASEQVNLNQTTYYSKYKKVFDDQGLDAFEIEEESTSVEAKHLSIEHKTKIFDVISRNPEYGAGRIKDELNSGKYGFLELSERKIYDELVRNRLNTRALREAYINRARKGNRRPKPPGTPFLTLDGDIVIRRPEVVDYTLDNDDKSGPEKDRKDTESVSENAEEPEKLEQNEPPQEQDTIEIDNETIREFESESLIDGSLDEILSASDMHVQEEQNSTEDLIIGGNEADDEVTEQNLEYLLGSEATTDEDVRETVDFGSDQDTDDQDDSLLDDFSFEELFEGGPNSEELNEDFDEVVVPDDETISGQDETETPASDAIEPQETEPEETEAETQFELEPESGQEPLADAEQQDDEPAPYLNESPATEEEIEDEATLHASNLEELLADATELDDTELPPADFLEVTADAAAPNEYDGVTDEDDSDNEYQESDDGDETVSFSDLIQSIDDEIVYVTRPPQYQDYNRPLNNEHGMTEQEDEFAAEDDDTLEDTEKSADRYEPANGATARNGAPDKETILIAGIKHYKSHDYNKAIEEFKKVIEVYPDYKEAHSILGNAYFRNRMYDEAATEYQRVKEIDPSDITAYENMGVIFANKGDYKQALSEWKRVMELNPERIDIKDKIKKALRMIS